MHGSQQPNSDLICNDSRNKYVPSVNNKDGDFKPYIMILLLDLMIAGEDSSDS
jgi:hypothetical protein